MSAKRKPMPTIGRKTKEEPNKAAIITAISIFAGLIVVVAALLIVNS